MNEVISIGEGKFAVIAGHKLNAEPLTRAETDRLAHEPVKPAAKLPPREAPPPPPKRKPAPQSAPQPAPVADFGRNLGSVPVALPALPFEGADDDRARRS
jgi:hypothetical protein